MTKKPNTHFLEAACLITAGMISLQATAQIPRFPTPVQKKDSANGTTANAKPVQGFVSKKTGKTFQESNIEDITNENFPDMIESFDYPNAEIMDVAKAISELTGKNFVVDPQVRGKITIMAPSRLTVAEAYKVFLSALAVNNMAVVPGDGFYKIKPAREAQKDSIETYSGAYYPASDQMITRIIKLKYISADEVNKNLRFLASKNGDLNPYPPTNSVIVSDYGSNVDRIVKIISQLDVAGFEEQLELIRIRNARAKDIADLIDQIINKGQKSQQGGFGAGIPRFNRPGGPEGSSSSSTEVYSLVLPDERTNSIVVVGNKAGIAKIRRLVDRLDFKLRAEDQGGVYVYYVKHSEAEQIANTLNGIATESKKAQDAQNQPQVPGGIKPPGSASSSNAIFGSDVKVASDKVTNSLIITASKPDYDIIKTILAKLDIARDQVFVKAVIMEMQSNLSDDWKISYYKFQDGTDGAARAGFSSGGLDTILNPLNDRGAIIGFGSGTNVNVKVGDRSFQVPNLMSFINLLKSTTAANVLSTPQIMALDNEESEIEVGEKVPVSVNQATTGTTVSNNVQRENVTIKLKLTPYISPEDDTVQMKIDQQVADIAKKQTTSAQELAKIAISTTTRSIKTQIVVNSGETAVLGGLMKDADQEDVTKIPVLGDIPVLGWLFKSRSVAKTKVNLLVLITPKIVRSTEDHAKIVTQKLNERIDFIKKNMGGRDVHGEYYDDIYKHVQSVSTRTKSKVKPQESKPAPGQEEPVQEEPAVESF